MTKDMKAKVAISNYHNGQICYPVAEAARLGRTKVVVRLYWVDQSLPHGDARREFKHAEFTGSMREAETWLMAQGVILDAQGIH